MFEIVAESFMVSVVCAILIISILTPLQLSIRRELFRNFIFASKGQKTISLLSLRDRITFKLYFRITHCKPPQSNVKHWHLTETSVVGAVLGVMLGPKEGALDRGAEDGTTLGVALGFALGEVEGVLVPGMRVGATVGALEGLDEGAVDGDSKMI